MSNGREGCTVVHSPTAGNAGLFPMQIGPYHDQALTKEAGSIAGLRFSQLKGFRVRQGHVKAVNQHQILHLVPMFDEGIKTVDAAGKEQRYAIARSRDIRGQLKGERYLVTTVNPGGVDIRSEEHTSELQSLR